MKFQLSRCTVFSFAPLLILVGSLAYSQEKAGPIIELGGRTVRLTLVKADDLSAANWQSGDGKVLAESIPVEANANVYTLLQANGIAPDTEAFTVVYDLNPTLRDVRALEPRTTLQLPKVVGGQDLRGMLHRGYLVMLTVDPKLRDELNRRIEALQGLVASFTLIPAERFPSTDASETAKSNVQSLGRWYAQIEKSFLRRTGPPLRQVSLVHLSNEADRLSSLLEEVVQSNGKLSAGDLGQITAIHDDVGLEMTKYGQALANEAPRADALYKVVAIIKGDNAGLIARLRVHYTINGLWEPPVNPPPVGRTYEHLGSGASDFLTVQNYKFWATLDGDPGHPLTSPTLLEVRPWKGDVQTVELSLEQRNPK